MLRAEWAGLHVGWEKNRYSQGKSSICRIPKEREGSKTEGTGCDGAWRGGKDGIAGRGQEGAHRPC